MQNRAPFWAEAYLENRVSYWPSNPPGLSCRVRIQSIYWLPVRENRGFRAPKPS